MFSYRLFNVHEVVSILEDGTDFQEARIYIDPPDEGNCDTDEDSGEEDGGGTISNLNPHQLTVPATVKVFRHGVREILDAGVECNENVSDCSVVQT